MTSASSATQPAAWGEFSPLFELFQESTTVSWMELKKLVRDPTELLTRGVQPILWLVIFGEVFTRVHGIPSGNVSYLAFITPGILAQSVLFTGIFYGIAVIWERDLGIVHKLLVTPAFRSSLALGKAAAAAFRGTVQTVIIYLIATVLGIGIRWRIPEIIGVLAAVALGSAIFSMFSLAIACIVKSRERFMGIGQVLTMPLFFASNAIYPLSLMPSWLRVISLINPLTYLVDALRAMMIQGGQSVHGLPMDFGILAAIFVVLISAAAKLYPVLVR